MERVLKGKMSVEYERKLRQELKHQKKLAKDSLKQGFDPSMCTYRIYETRIHLLSWVLKDSSTF
jgi:hypothetical protein